jgi:hypothetical protein
LIDEFAKEYDHQIDEDVVNDIFLRTGGQIGLVTFCGYILQGFERRTAVSLRNWLPTIIRATRDRLSGKLDFVRRINSFMERTEVLSFIVDKFLSLTDGEERGPGFVSVDESSIDLARSLAAEGLLDVDRKNQKTISSAFPLQ